MTIPSYGIPDANAKLAELDVARQQVTDQFGGLASKLALDLFAGVSDVEKQSAQVAGPLKRSLDASKRYVGQQMDLLDNKLQGDLFAHQGNIQSDITRLALAASGVPQTSQQVLWYVYRDATGNCHTMQTADPSQLPGGPAGGGFTSYNDAIAWMSVNCGAPPVPVLPTPAEQPPPPQPISVPPPAVNIPVPPCGTGAIIGTALTRTPEGWIILATNGATTQLQLNDALPTSFTPAGYLYIVGNVAYVWGGPCGPVAPPPISHPLPPIIGEPPPITVTPPPCPPQQPCPPPPPCETSPPPQQQAVSVCDIKPPAIGSYVVGSVEWCGALEQTRGQLIILGQSIIAAAGTALANLLPPGWTGQGVVQGTISGLQQTIGLGPGLQGAISAVVGQYTNATSDLVSTIKCWAQAIKAVAPCDGPSMVAIAAVLSAMRLLRRLRAGTDAAVWLTLDIEASVEPVEHIAEYLLRSLCPVEIPSPEVAMECHLKGTITRPQYECWLLVHGCHPSTWEPALQARRERLTTEETIRLAWRQDWSDDLIAQELSKLGWINPIDQSNRLELHWELPTVADHLHWMMRNVFDDTYVQQYNLMEGFDERFWSKFGHDLEAQGMRKDYAALHYAAHWIRPAPTQGQEFVYRLRPDKPGVLNPFTVQDYKNLLAEQDISPFDRQRFGEIIYRVPALSYLRDMYRMYLLSDDQLRSYHQDLGYGPDDSELFVRTDHLVRARIRATEAHGWNTTAIAHGFISGQLNPDRVHALMGEQGFTHTESDALMERAQSDLQYTSFTRARSRTIFASLSTVKSCLSVGTCDGQTAAGMLKQMGWDERFAQSWVDMQTADSRVKVVRQAVGRIRGQFLTGELSADVATGALQQLGIVPDMIRTYLATWLLEFTPKRKRRGASQVVNDLCQNQISESDAVSRWTNLGYNAQDTALYIADSKRCLNKREQRQADILSRQRNRQARELLRLRRDAQRQANQLLAAARRAEPVAKLQSWAEKKLILPQYFLDRMTLYGYSKAEIERYWDEAAAKKHSQAEPGAIAHLSPTPSNGRSGPPPE